MNLTRFLPALLAALALSPLALMAAGRARFNRDWRRTGLEPGPEDGLAGRWQGRWKSARNGHQGRLRCLITRLQPGQYGARFQADYKKVLSFGHTLLLEPREENARFDFTGSAPLGWWAGGRFHYAGEATPTRFFSTYNSRHDEGSFEMGRPLPEPGPAPGLVQPDAEAGTPG